MIPLIIITHGKIAQELVKTASVIVGQQEHIYFLEVGAADSIDILKGKVEEMVSKFSEIPSYGGTLIMTDMLGSSACNMCIPLLGRHRMFIVSGVNLYMLISAIKNRESMALEELKDKVATDAIRSIKDICSILTK